MSKESQLSLPPRLFTVGRLDVQSTGLILVTNDGVFLAHATTAHRHYLKLSFTHCLHALQWPAAEITHDCRHRWLDADELQEYCICYQHLWTVCNWCFLQHVTRITAECVGVCGADYWLLTTVAYISS